MLKAWYKYSTGKNLSLKHPKTFCEKIQWLKLYNRKELYTQMVDKVTAKEYVSGIIGEQHIIKTIAVFNKVEDIKWDILPNKFVIKCNHDSGSVMICKDKRTFDIIAAEKKLYECINRMWYYPQMEWAYKNVVPRILVEEYIESENSDLRDYKFFCFNGKTEYFKVDFNRFVEHHANYFDRNGNLQEFGEAAFPPKLDLKIELPSNLHEMVEMADVLSQNIGAPFVRIDLYNHMGKILFGEITFYPMAGVCEIIPSIWDVKLGRLIRLNTDQMESIIVQD